MKNIMILFIITVCVTQCAKNNHSHPLNPAEFESQLKKKNGILIDVRTAKEFNNEAMNGAVNMSVEDSDFVLHIAELDKTKPYFVYCGIGKRSARACNIMSKYGFTNVYDLEGGLAQWKKNGFPVRTGSVHTNNNNSLIIK